jgi:hypothetical protein
VGVVRQGCRGYGPKDGVVRQGCRGYGPKDGVVRQGCRGYGPKDGKRLVRFWEGLGYNSGHGRDHVAPPGPFCVEQNRTHAVRPQGAHQGWCASNQAANREHKVRPTVGGVPRLHEIAQGVGRLYQAPGLGDREDIGQALGLYACKRRVIGYNRPKWAPEWRPEGSA